jgi:hypothetical protein
MSFTENDLKRLIREALSEKEAEKKPEKESNLKIPTNATFEPTPKKGHLTLEEMANCPDCKPKILAILEPEIRAKIEPEIKAKSLKHIVDIAKGNSHCKTCGLRVDPKAQDLCPLCGGYQAE